jgi:hypothetical protein
MTEVPELTLSYLAAPYTDSDPTIVADRIERLCKTDAKLMKKGIFTVSPLLKHFIIQHEALPGDWEYWRDYSAALLCGVDRVFVLTLPGWKESVGVQAEIRLATDVGIPVFYIDELGEIVNE